MIKQKATHIIQKVSGGSGPNAVTHPSAPALEQEAQGQGKRQTGEKEWGKGGGDGGREGSKWDNSLIVIKHFTVIIFFKLNSVSKKLFYEHW